ncbi:MAG TPA: glycosyltransferase family 39 protein [Dehalococcoidia bacterium]|nr:glycosyltransferase family 39 protein [Dehalococcoidia bacterium]
MAYRRPAPGQTLTALLDFARRHPDLLLCGAITLLAAALRLWALGDIPAGIHGDEAQVGLDARRVLHDGWIGAYTWSALGQPSGHAYLTAPSIAIFGSNAWALRLPLALTGVAAIPLSYVLFRLLTTRVEAAIAAVLLATSLWHLHFSRVAHWPISYGTVALAVLILWTIAIRTGRWQWFAAAGAVLGLGLYTYNVYPIFVIAFAIWVAAYTFIYKRGDGAWLRHVALAAGVSVAAGLPLFIFIATQVDEYFAHYDEYYSRYSVLRSARFQDGDLTGKVTVVAEQAWRFAGAYVWQGVRDKVDGASADGRPIVDPATVALFLVGLGMAAWRWRAPPYLLCLCMVGVMPLAGLLQTNATYRGTLGLAPFVYVLAALPLAVVWREASNLAKSDGRLLKTAVVFALGLIAFVNLHSYFGRWAGSEHFDSVYARDFTQAVQYANSLDGQPYVFFLSDEFTFNHETRLFLAPDLEGEDRSTEFLGWRDLFIYATGDAILLLTNAYAQDDTLDSLQELYPGGAAYIRERDGRRVFVVYTLPQRRLAPP